MTLVVNGRFLRARPTGLHRVGRNLLDAARASGLAAEVVAPEGVVDDRVDRTTWAPPGRAGDHLWEQLVLPTAARRQRVLSLANTGPWAASRSIVLVHDLAPMVGPEWFVGSMRLYRRIVVTAARRAETVLTVSGQVAGELQGIGVAPGRIHVVRPAVDARLRPASAAEVSAVRARYGLSRPYVLHLGWADPRKDAVTLAAAHLAATEERPHDLVLAGTSHPNFAPVSLPPAPSIRRIGYVDDADLPALLTGAAVFAYPSRYEGFGLPPLEAMACGTPVVAADTPSLRESTAGSATLVPPGDAARLAAGLVRGLSGELAPPAPPAWTWDQSAAQLLAALAG